RHVQVARLREVGREHGKGPPGSGEAEIGVHPPPHQLEAVTDDEQGAHDDERRQSAADPCDAVDTAHHPPGQHEHAGNERRGPGTRPRSNPSRPPRTAPPTGSTARVYSHHSGRQSGDDGTWNSNEAMTPPGRTTRASSARAAAGSAT